MSEIKSRPILFSAPMVKAILDGRKVQTRRIIKPQREIRWIEAHGEYVPKSAGWYAHIEEKDSDYDTQWERRDCPYGEVGDRLWVRETWQHYYFGKGGVSAPGVRYAADSALMWRPEANQVTDKKWRPSIFMPRWASRIELEITAIRVERLNQISSTDALAEGVNPFDKSEFPDPVGAFIDLWESINGADSWAANPWVWCLSFERVTL